MIKTISMATAAFTLAAAPALAHVNPAEHAHAGSVTLFAVPLEFVFGFTAIAAAGLVILMRKKILASKVRSDDSR